MDFPFQELIRFAPPSAADGGVTALRSVLAAVPMRRDPGTWGFYADTEAARIVEAVAEAAEAHIRAGDVAMVVWSAGVAPLIGATGVDHLTFYAEDGDGQVYQRLGRRERLGGIAFELIEPVAWAVLEAARPRVAANWRPAQAAGGTLVAYRDDLGPPEYFEQTGFALLLEDCVIASVAQ